MSISYPNLPGIEVTVNDGGLILPEEASTERLLIIGPCDKADAPEEPVLVRDSSSLKELFGDFVDANGKVNPVAAAWKAAFEGGCRVIYVMAVKGSDEKTRFVNLQDALFGILADFEVDHVVLKDMFVDKEAEGIQASDLLNPEHQANFPNVPGVMRYAYLVQSTAALDYPINITASTNDSFIINDGTTDINITLTAVNYDGSTGKELDDLAADIESDIVAAAGLENFKVIVEDNKLVILGDKAFTVKPGSAGDALATLKLTANEQAAKKRHKQGEIYNGNFAKVLADYCENQTINNNTVVGYIGTTSATSSSLADVKTHVEKLANLEVDYSGHLSVVAGPDLGYLISGKSGVYYANGVVTYAALVTTLRPESATTNKAVSGVTGLRYNMSLNQLNTLSGKKYVSFRMKNGQIRVTDGITTAPDIVQGQVVRNSDFIRLSTLRITHAAVKLIREIADPFVGEPNGLPQYNALHAAIKSGLESMKAAGAISDYRFTIVQDRGASILGQSKITLELVPAFEVKKITVDVSLRSLLN